MSSFVRLVLWATVWLPFWILIEIYRFLFNRPRLDNCLSWAVRRWHRKGGYLVIRWCRSSLYPWMKWPHFGWMSDQQHENIYHFLPVNDTSDKHLLPDLWFEGRMKRGDAANDEDVEN